MTEPRTAGQETGLVDLSALISTEEWALYRAVVERARARGLSFALGGGLAVSAYSGHWRNTKDLDLFVLPEEREDMIAVMDELGLVDYHDREEYDRTWIYRAYGRGMIVDIIWEMANHRAVIDEVWLTRGEEIVIHGDRLRLIPVEELIWAKAYIMQRVRCDWPDLLNILDVHGPDLRWEHLLQRLGQDTPLLAALLSVFGWLCPARAHELPAWIWSRLGLAGPTAGPGCDENRRQVMLLDSRDWFGRTMSGW